MDNYYLNSFISSRICEELSKTSLFVILFQFLHHIVAQCFCFYSIISGLNYIVVVIVFAATMELLFFCYAGQRLSNAVLIYKYFF